MAYTYPELKKKTIEELREIAKGMADESLKGHTQMNKEHLLPVLCSALGVESRGHQAVVGIDKSAIKGKLRQLKGEREKALAAHDHKLLKQIRRQMHRLKRHVRAATV
jgi:DNA-binding IclR family transcriptional regulator